MDAELVQAARRLAQARHVVCLTGAGVSAESGVETFRDAQTGWWSRFDPQQLASRAGFAADPGLVWRWYTERLATVEAVQPNAGHRALAALAAHLADFTLVTQNIDNLHERAGSARVLHLHGSLARFRCNDCAAPHSLQPAERAADQPPRCTLCGGPVRPDVVWFGERLPGEIVEQAWAAAERCQAMLVVGTSGVVYPAAHLPDVARRAGAAVIDVNLEPTFISQRANFFLQGPSGQVLPRLLAALEQQLRLARG
jgi:NAD-dependent deacetylase